MKMAKEKSDVQIGDEREIRFRNWRISQGWLSFKRNRPSFKKQRQGNNSPDMWGLFDVFSMKVDMLELCQVKGPDSRGEQKRIREWMLENADMLPENLRCIVAYEKRPGVYRIVEIKI